MKIVLLRGLIREKRHWGDFVSRLKAHLPDALVRTPEIPGVGEFHKDLSPDNIDDMIHFMRKSHADLFTETDTTMVAMSLGGMIAKRWCELYPKDFKNLILVNTSFRGINPLLKRMQPLSILNIIRIFFTPGIHRREAAIVKMTSNNSSNYEKVTKEWIEIQKTAPVSRKNFINQLKAATTFVPSKEKPEINLTILAAKKDRMCHHESSIALNNLWGGKLIFHPEAGHDFSLDDPEWLIEQIKAVAQAAKS